MKKLTNLDAHEVSLVPKGANKKRFLILKQDGKMTEADKKALTDLIAKVDPQAMEKVQKAIDGMCKLGEGQEVPMDERAQTALKAATRILLPFKDQIKDTHLASSLDAAGFFDGETSNPGSPMEGTAGHDVHQEDDGEGEGEMEGDDDDGEGSPMPIKDEHRIGAMKAAEGAYGEHLQKLGYQKYPPMQPRIKRASVRPNNFTKTPADGDGKEQGGHDVSKQVKILKEDGSLDLAAVPEEMRSFAEVLYKGHQDAVKKADKLQGELDAERNKRETQEFVAKAASLDKLSVKAEELGPILLKVSKALSAEEFAKVEASLKSFNEQVKKGDLFKELGSKAEDAGGSSWEKIEAGAAALVQKSSEKLTKAQGIEAFLTTDAGRTLQMEYEAEKGRKL